MDFEELFNSIRYPKVTKSPVTMPTYQISSDEYNTLTEAVRILYESGKVSYSITIDNNTSAIINTSATDKTLKFTPHYYKREGADTPVEQIVVMTYTVTTIVGTEEVTVATGNAVGNQMVSIDIEQYLSAGDTTTFNVECARGDVSQTTSISVVYTSLSLDTSNFAWYTPFVQGNTYSLGVFNVYGNIQKTLNVSLTVGDETTSYTVNCGTGVKYNVEVPITFPTFSGSSAVAQVKVWLEAGGVSTDVETFPLICVKSDYATTADVVAVKKVASTLINNQQNEIFDYAVYSKGSSTATMTFTINGTENSISVSTGTENTYSTDIDIETEEETLDIVCRIACGDNYQEYTITLDNSSSHPATSGAVFYLNPATRDNGQSNRESIINQATQETVTATWTKLAWIDGADGWTVDDNDRKCLRIPARSKCEIDYTPLSTSISNGRTIEFTFKAMNVADYDETIISIVTDRSTENSIGLRIKPTNIALRSANTASVNDNGMRSCDVKDEEIVNVVVTIWYHFFTGVTNGNLAIGYINGVKKFMFQFNDNDSWISSGKVILGCDNADLFLYNMRVYENVMGFSNATQNYIASLTDGKDEAYEKNESILDGESVSFDKVKTVANYFTIELTDGSESSYHPELGYLPTFGHLKDYESNGDFFFSFHDTGRTLSVANMRFSGQGTTSMNYWLWNGRGRTDKNSDTVTTYSDGTTSTGYCDFFGDGVQSKRITWKKNYASSSQGHKMGSTAAFNDLHDAVVGQNEAEGRVAVYQIPAYGFLKIPLEGGGYSYQFLGMFTIGADKGDKPTFKWDGTYKNTLMSLEGTDHSPKLATFAYPWNSEVETYTDGDSYYVAIKKGDADYENGWEVGNACGAKAIADYVTNIDTYFKPAYLVAYENSTMIKPIPDGYTIDSMNANPSAFGALTDSDGNPYEYYEFYDENGDLYYLDKITNQYIKTGVNVFTQTGATTEDEIKTWRRQNFKTNMETYWNLNDTLFHYCFLVIFGASDNFAKNSYPYNLDPATLKWRWIQDDLDTIFDIDNQGVANKSYSIEYTDLTSTGNAFIFKGNQSTFWRLINECYTDDIRSMGYNILSAMSAKASAGSTSIDRLVQFFYDYYWNRAQNYFPKSAYNLDSEISYEQAYPYFGNGYNPDVNPLKQALGDHYEAEREWILRRMIYCMSKFRFGSFADTQDVGLGVLALRTQVAQTFDITPAMDLYPMLRIGASSFVRSDSRIKAGDSVSLTGGGTNTDVYIIAADWISDLGDLKDLQVDNANAPTFAGKRLQTLKLGDSDASEVTSSVVSVNIGNCPSLVTLDARNLSGLVSQIDLSNCPRIKEALFEGTQITTVQLPSGSKIEVLSIPGTVKNLSFLGLKYLTDITYETMDSLTYLRVENCNESVPSFDILQKGSSSIRAIRLVNMNETISEASTELLYNLAVDATSESRTYYGINADGTENTGIIPVLSGSLTSERAPIDWKEKIEEAFTDLSIIIEVVTIYIKDTQVRAKLVSVGAMTEGETSVVQSEIASKSYSLNFSSDTAVVSFDELMYFNRATNEAARFNGCTALESVKFCDEALLMYSSVFDGCTSLKSVHLSSALKSIATSAFYNCTSLESIVIPDGVTTIYDSAFYGCTGISELSIPSGVTDIRGNAFYNCIGLKDISNLGENVSLGSYCLYGTGLSEITIKESWTVSAPYLLCGNCANLTKVAILNQTGMPTAGSSYGGTMQQCYGNNIEYLTIGGSVTSIPYGESSKRSMYLSSLKKFACTADLSGMTSSIYSWYLYAMESIYFVEGLSIIGTSCIECNDYNGTVKVCLPSTVTSIENMNSGNAYYDPTGTYRYADGGGFYYIKATTPPTIDSDSLMRNIQYIFVPDDSVTAYRAATNWSNLKRYNYKISSYEERIYGISDFETLMGYAYDEEEIFLNF